MQGTVSLRRKGGQVTGFLQVGGSAITPFAALNSPGGPVVVGVQILYGFTYSITISNITVVADRTVTPQPSPLPTPVPAAAVLPTWRTSSSESSWRSLFSTRNGVGFSNTTGTATLAGTSFSAASLAPSAGLLSKLVFTGDFQMDVTIADYSVLQ